MRRTTRYADDRATVAWVELDARVSSHTHFTTHGPMDYHMEEHVFVLRYGEPADVILRMTQR
jgi:hypothetical protein